ncbi:transcription elongation factor GreA [Flavihumibacter sp. R14]|nr:transcription elongation factor GreA [Flavihumibacter soli]
MMTNALLISQSDFDLLQTHLIRSGSNLSEFNKTKLKDELKTAKVVKDKDLPENIASLNSVVQIKNIESGQVFKFQLVLPGEANFAEHRVSVFAPIGVALLGYPIGSEIQWEMPDGLKTFEIISCESPQKKS